MGSEESKNTKHAESVLTFVACIMMFFTFAGNSAITPALNSMKVNLWSDLPESTITLISTLPSLFAIAGCVISGALAGRYIKWKPLIAIAFLIYSIFGVLPAVFRMEDFYQVLIMRAGCGLGMGMLLPLGNSLVLRIYSGDKQDSVLGIGQSFQSLGGVAMQLTGGFLATIAPEYSFYTYFIALVGLGFTMAGLPDLPLDEPQVKKKEKVPRSCYGFLLLLFLGVMSITPVLINSSSIVANRGLGDSAMAGIVSSFYTLGGVAAGVAFGFTFKRFEKWTIPLGYLGCAASTLAMFLSTELFALIASMFLSAFFFVQVRPAIYKIVGTMVSPAQTAAMVGVAAALYNFGNFMGTYYVKAVNLLFFGGAEGADHAIIASSIIFLILSISTALVLHRK